MGAMTSELSCEGYVEIGVNQGKKQDNAISDTGKGGNEGLYRCLLAVVTGD